MKKLGLIINPIAGMGGSVGLKGTDGMLKEALRRGAAPRAAEKTMRALKALLPLRESLVVLCAGGGMGSAVLSAAGFSCRAVYQPLRPCSAAIDTKAAARAMAKEAVDIIAFSGGDGTARDIYEAVGENFPVLGIPAGVKIHSPAFARSPEKAGELLHDFLRGHVFRLQEAEVLDIDEELYRKGVVSTRLVGYLLVPCGRQYMQGGKTPSPLSEKSQQQSIAAAIAEEMSAGFCYIVGPGSTTQQYMEYMQAESTLLGVDVLRRGKTVVLDAAERDILACMEDMPAKLIITPTGKQGYLLGRGNQQISPKVIKKLGKANIIVAATPLKLASLSGMPLLVDTGDPAADALMRGYVKVVAGYRETMVYPVE